MDRTGSSDTRLIILRGNSASGKTSAAWRIRESFGSGIAIVSQDVIRRDVLKQPDHPGNAAIGLIDLTARYALDFGFHVVLEGILYSDIYGPMLQCLAAEHQGRTHAYYWDIPFAKTVQRHTASDRADSFNSDQMAEWYRPHDIIPALNERVFDGAVSQDDAVQTILRETELIHL